MSLSNSICIAITTVYHLMFVLQGTNLDQIRLELDDVMIKIGKSECYVTSTGRQLTCRPPKEQPIPVKSRLYPEVEVYIAVRSVNESIDAIIYLYIFFISIKSWLITGGYALCILTKSWKKQVFMHNAFFKKILNDMKIHVRTKYKIILMFFFLIFHFC